MSKVKVVPRGGPFIEVEGKGDSWVNTQPVPGGMEVAIVALRKADPVARAVLDVEDLVAWARAIERAFGENE